MSHLQDIFTEYARMRDNGLDTKAALNALRSHIESLSKAEREELAAHLRGYEGPEESPSQMKKPNAIRPIGKQEQPALTPIRPLKPVAPDAYSTGDAQDDQIVWVTCPNCQKANQKHEVFCYSCGQLLEPVKGSFDTQHFADPDNQPMDKDYFGEESVLALRVRGSLDHYELRPQNSDHELIIGRSTDGSAMAPDVDLRDRKGADLGVSRLHLSVFYDYEHHGVLVSDLGSANGSFINGQRIMAKEVRVLRHGDELRLGKLVLSVSFRHPGRS